MDKQNKAVIALAGNPNSGKTTLFNELTGARQHVGNYPGITVEKKEGIYINNGHKINIVDLPGIYSLTAYSLEEVVARDFLVNEKPKLIVNIVDASNLTRNLYLSLQFMELGMPMCIALNMMDVAENRGIEINTGKLSTLLNIPIVPIVARSGKGINKLMHTVIKTLGNNSTQVPLDISYGDDIDRIILDMNKEIEKDNFLTSKYPTRWTAIKYLENDKQIKNLGAKADIAVSEKLEKMVKKVSDHIETTLKSYPEAEIPDHRYGYIKSITSQVVSENIKDKDRLYLSDKIDNILTNRFIGPIIMVAVIIGLYHFTFTYSEIPVGWFESFFGFLETLAITYIPDGLIKSLIVSGIIAGVGGVLGFVPIIIFMFMGIAILEDSGYLSRVAYMLDRIFKSFGLHGSSVMPFIVGGGIAGGCAVPGIMAARTLKSPRERLATLLTVPFMNCGAKLPVFALLIAAFFVQHKALIMFAITVISWAGALLTAKLLRTTIIKGMATPFVMELPPYRIPTIKGVLIHTWERTWQYVKKAGTVIFAISVILWAMMTFPNLPDNKIQEFENMRIMARAESNMKTINASADKTDDNNFSNTTVSLQNRLNSIDNQEAEEHLLNSIAGRIGTGMESFSKIAGFNWKINIALLGGFAAKEVIVSTLGTAYSIGAIEDPEKIEPLSKALVNSPEWNPLVAFSLIIFTIFYAPCFVAVVCIVKEAGSWKWGAFSIIFNTALSFFLATLVFQIGSRIKYFMPFAG